jgi:hypothetical protein
VGNSDAEADRIRGLVLLRATCETVMRRLDEDDIDDLALTIQLAELCETLDGELERFAKRDQDPRPSGSDHSIGA